MVIQLNVPIPERQEAVLLPARVFQWTEDEFFSFCQSNRHFRIERSAKGDIIVMSPAGGYSGYRSGTVFRQLSIWAEQVGTGIAFGSSAGFLLPNGAMRAPDAAWVRLARLQTLTRRQKEQFIPLCPRFCDRSRIALGYPIEFERENIGVPRLRLRLRMADLAGDKASGNLHLIGSDDARGAGNGNC